MKRFRISIFSVILIVALLAGSTTAFAKETVVLEQDEKVLLEEQENPALEEETTLAEEEEPFLLEKITEEELTSDPAVQVQEETEPENPENPVDPGEDPDPEDPPEDEPVVPDVPKLKKAEISAKGITVTWNAVTDAESYEVYLISNKSGKHISVGTTDQTSFEYTDVKSGTVYTFTVSAKIGEVTGEADSVGIGMVYLSQIKPSVTRSGDAASLKWSKVKGADGYAVYRRISGQSEWKRVKSLTTAVYKDTKVKEGQTYEYSVRAFKSYNGKNRYNLYSDKDVVTFRILPAATLKKMLPLAKSIKVQWKKVKGAKTYKVYRKTAGKKWTLIKTTSSTSYVDKKAKAGTVYYYTVVPYDSQNIRGNYNKAGRVGIYFKTAKAPTVTNDANGIKISWNAVKNATGYRVYRKLSSSEKWKGVQFVTGTTSWLDEKVESGNKYDYLVLPYKTVKGTKYYSYYTAKSSSTIEFLDPPALSGIECLASGLKISWGKIDGAKGYAVYRKAGKNGTWSLLAKTKKLSYIDKSAGGNTIYYYSVSAYAGDNESAYGNRTVYGMYLQKPVLNPIESVNSGLKVSWRPVAGATGYYVYRVLSSGKLKYLKKTTATTYTDTKVADGKTYAYTVRAYNKNCKKVLSSYAKKGRKGTYTDPLRATIRSKLDACGWDLLEAFNWARKISFIDLQPRTTNTRDYARWTLDNNKGDCYGKAAVFCLMARELGYECYLMKGWTPFANGGGTEHGWVEIKKNGEWYVCDLSYNNGGVNSAYMIKYGQAGTLRYSDYHRMP